MWLEILRDIFVVVMSKVILKAISSKGSKLVKALRNNLYQTGVLVCLVAIATGVWTIILLQR